MNKSLLNVVLHHKVSEQNGVGASLFSDDRNRATTASSRKPRTAA